MDTKPGTNRRRKKRRKNALVTTVIILFNVALVMLVGISIYKIYTYFFDIGFQVASEDEPGTVFKEVEVFIPAGSGAREIGEVLAESGLIKNALAFYVQCRLKNVDDTFYSGPYTLNTQMSFDELIAEMQTLPEEAGSEISFTAIEGDTVADIANKLEQAGIVPAGEFMEAAETIEFDYTFLTELPARTPRLEGYLFPDTYFLTEDMPPEEIINRMLDRMDGVYQAYKDEAQARGMSMDEVMTVASIIEKEVMYGDERPIVASVIFNRLDSGMRLQIDATVLYAMGRHKDRLSEEDTQTESPYNTYTVGGLPPGPICNPGEACVKAALNPADTDFIYYVVQNAETGQHYFTNNYDDFLAAKQRYLNSLP